MGGGGGKWGVGVVSGGVEVVSKGVGGKWGVEVVSEGVGGKWGVEVVSGGCRVDREH